MTGLCVVAVLLACSAQAALMGPAGQLVFEMSFGTQAEHCLDASLRSAYFLSRGASFVGINPRGWGRSTSFPKADEKKKKTDVTVSGDVQFAIEWVMQHQFATQFQANGYADAVIAGYSLGGYSATRAAVELAVAGTPPGALLLINSIASSYLAAKDDFAGPIAKLGEKALGSKFDMLTALRAFCQLRRPDGGEMRLIAISGNDRLDHLSLTKTDIPTVGAACSVHSGETDPQFGHFALAKMFSHGQNGPNDALVNGFASMPQSATTLTTNQCNAVAPVVVPPADDLVRVEQQ